MTELVLTLDLPFEIIMELLIRLQALACQQWQKQKKPCVNRAREEGKDMCTGNITPSAESSNHFSERALLCRAIGLLQLITDEGIDNDITAVVNNTIKEFREITRRESMITGGTIQ